MEWSDNAIVLSSRPHGETSAIITVLTAEHGRHAGLVRGGAGRKLRGTLQSGNEVAATWRARLEEHLGTMSLELTRARAATLLDNGARLAGLTAACAMSDAAMPEREPHRAVYDGLLIVLDALADAEETWPAVYVRWELGLLQELGYGLDLSRCAANGTSDDLAYVSPRTGRAVSRQAAGQWRDRLLPLPAFLLGAQGGAINVEDLRDGLRLTGYFLEHTVLRPQNRKEPQARTRLVELFSSANTKYSSIMAP